MPYNRRAKQAEILDTIFVKLATAPNRSVGFFRRDIRRLGLITHDLYQYLQTLKDEKFIDRIDAKDKDDYTLDSALTELPESYIGIYVSHVSKDFERLYKSRVKHRNGVYELLDAGSNNTASGNETKETVYISSVYGLYVGQPTKQSACSLIRSQMRLIVYLQENGPAVGSAIRREGIYRNKFSLSKAIKTINAKWKRFLKVEDDIVTHNETSGYNLNKQKYHFELTDD